MMYTNDWQSALETSERLLRTDPDHLGALETLAQAQWFAGHFDDVIATTTKLLKLNPSEPGYRYTRGMAHLSKGELSKASEDFRNAIVQSNNAEFREQVGCTLMALERWMTEAPRPQSRFGAPFPGALGKPN